MADASYAAGQDFDSKHHRDPTMKRIPFGILASALVVFALDPLANRAGAQTARDSVLATEELVHRRGGGHTRAPPPRGD